jgi:hypothetical protein
MNITPCVSWTAMDANSWSFSATVVVLDNVASEPRGWVFDCASDCAGRTEGITEETVGWYSVQREQASVACVRRIAAEMGEALESSLPVGDSRRRVGSAGVVFWERNVVRRLVRSIVFDMGTGVEGKWVLAGGQSNVDGETDRAVIARTMASSTCVKPN